MSHISILNSLPRNIFRQETYRTPYDTENFLVTYDIYVNFCAFLPKLNSKLYYMRKGTTLRVQPKPLSVTKRATHEFDR